MTTNTQIERIFKDLTHTSEFKLHKTIIIDGAKYDLTLRSWQVFDILPAHQHTFPNDNVKIEIFKKNINVYILENIYFYKHTLVENTKKYIPIEGYILNKHVVKKYPHTHFDLNRTICVPFKYTPDFELFFVFDIEDKRETYADTLNLLVERQILPPEIIEMIAFKLGMTELSDNGIYNKTQFPFNFVSKYKLTMPECFVKEQLIELYKLGVFKLAYYNSYHASMNILTDESYDYVFPNAMPNKIRNIFSSKEEMQEFVRKHADDFLKS